MAQEVSTLTKRQVHKFCFYILFQLSTFSCNFINLNLKNKKKQQIEEKNTKKSNKWAEKLKGQAF